MYWEHDVTTPPIGRTTRAWLEQLDDGEYAVKSEGEVFEGLWAAHLDDERLAAAGLSMTLPPVAEGKLSIGFDPLNYDEAEIEELVSAAAEVGEASHEHRLRKAMIPPPDLVIYLVAAAAPFWFAKGFFTRAGEKLAEPVGEDLGRAYKRFKEGIARVLKNRRPPEVIPALIVEIPVGKAVVRGSVKTTTAQSVKAFLDAVEDLYRRGMVLLDEMGQDNVQVLHFDFEPKESEWHFSFFIELDGNVTIASDSMSE